MIAFLASLFRMVHGVMGITAPEPGKNERAFVYMWLVGLALFALFCWFLFYLMMNVF